MACRDRSETYPAHGPLNCDAPAMTMNAPSATLSALGKNIVASYGNVTMANELIHAP